MGTALAASSFAFAQEMPFTITTDYNTVVTGANFELGALGGTMRTATGVNGKHYFIDRANGQIWSFDGTKSEKYATVDVLLHKKTVTGEDGTEKETGDALNIAITADDAGNLIVSYADGDFWAGTMTYFGIVSAKDQSVTYTDAITLPGAGEEGGFAIGRSDLLGRIVGDVLSEDGGYLYVTGAKSGNHTCCLHFVNGVPTAEEYTSSDLGIAGAGMSYAVPMYNNVAEQADADPMYDAFVFCPWNGSGLVVTNEEDGATTLPRYEVKDSEPFYSSVPGGDLINREDGVYYIQPYTRVAGKRTADIIITDAEGNLVWKTDTKDTWEAAGLDPTALSFINGGGIYVHQTGDYSYELFTFEGHNQGAIAAKYTINFPVPEPGKIFLVGQPTGWQEPSEDNAEHYANFVLNETGIGTGVFEGEFNIAANEAMFRFYTSLSGWDGNASLGAQEVDAPVDCAFTNNEFAGNLVAGKGSFNFPAWKGGKMAFTVNTADNTVKIVATPDPVKAARAAYAYDINLAENEGEYTVTYKATGAAPASLVLSAEGLDDVVIAMPAAVEGENTFTFSNADLAANTQYAVAVALDNASDAEVPAIVFQGEQFANQTRGGVVVINDTESDAFGYVVVAAGKAQGFQVYTPALESKGTFHAGDAKFAAGNQSSPFRGAAREGLAVFCDWADAGSNYWTIDPLNPETLGQMLDAPAVKDAAGMWTIDGVPVGGGNSGLAFAGKGENTKMYTLIEDFTDHANTLARYDLGTATQILAAPAAWYPTVTGQLPNLNLQMQATSHGVFATQVRANVDEASLPRLVFFQEGEDKIVDSWWNDEIPNAAGGVAVSADESLLAVATQSEIRFFAIEWEGDKPALTLLPELTFKHATDFADLQFDVAGNLYIYSRGDQRLDVVALPGAGEAVTAAKAAFVVNGPQGGEEPTGVVTFDFANNYAAYADFASMTAGNSNGTEYYELGDVTLTSADAKGNKVEVSATDGATNTRMWNTTAGKTTYRIYGGAVLTFKAEYPIEKIEFAGQNLENMPSEVVDGVYTPAEPTSTVSFTMADKKKAFFSTITVTLKTESGVADVEIDENAPVEYFNLQGIRVEGELTPGLYIRRQGNATSKVVVR